MVHAPMMGEKRKLTLEVPNFCIKNRRIRTAAERASTKAAINQNSKYLRGWITQEI